jgi:hypothetical protein
MHELAEILDALLHRLVVFLHALEVHEAGHVAHRGTFFDLVLSRPTSAR